MERLSDIFNSWSTSTIRQSSSVEQEDVTQAAPLVAKAAGAVIANEMTKDNVDQAAKPAGGPVDGKAIDEPRTEIKQADEVELDLDLGEDLGDATTEELDLDLGGDVDEIDIIEDVAPTETEKPEEDEEADPEETIQEAEKTKIDEVVGLVTDVTKTLSDATDTLKDAWNKIKDINIALGEFELKDKLLQHQVDQLAQMYDFFNRFGDISKEIKGEAIVQAEDDAIKA